MLWTIIPIPLLNKHSLKQPLSNGAIYSMLRIFCSGEFILVLIKGFAWGRKCRTKPINFWELNWTFLLIMLFSDMKSWAERFQFQLNSPKVILLPSSTEIFYFIQFFNVLITNVFMTTGLSQLHSHIGIYNTRICQNIFFLEQ